MDRDAVFRVCLSQLCVHREAFFQLSLDIVRAQDDIFMFAPGDSACTRTPVSQCVPKYLACTGTSFSVRPWRLRVQRDAIFLSVPGQYACTGTLFLGCVPGYFSCTGTTFFGAYLVIVRVEGRRFFRSSLDIACAQGRRFLGASLEDARAH